MGDHVSVSSGSYTAVVASDEIGATQYQRIKLIHGADGVNDGDVATGNPLPVQLRTSGGTEIGAATAFAVFSRVIAGPKGATAAADVTSRSVDADHQALDVYLNSTLSSSIDSIVSVSSGNVAHDDVDSGNPIKVGLRALAHGSNPTAVAAADRTDWLANRHGIPWMIAGHPNIITREITILDSDGAQTDASLVGTISAGTKVVVTGASVQADADNTANVACRIGFGASTLPTATSSGVVGIVLSHGDIVPGGQVREGDGSGIVGIGGDGEELRMTCDDPAGGDLRVIIKYYTIES